MLMLTLLTVTGVAMLVAAASIRAGQPKPALLRAPVAALRRVGTRRTQR